jgi:hypothetical protein
MIACPAVQLRQSESNSKRAGLTYFNATSGGFAKRQFEDSSRLIAETGAPEIK